MAYEVFVLDSGNMMGIIGDDGLLDKEKFDNFIDDLDVEFQELVKIEKNSKMIKYLVSKGYIEFWFDKGFGVKGFFNDEKEARRFKKTLRKVIDIYNGRTLDVDLDKVYERGNVDN